MLRSLLCCAILLLAGCPDPDPDPITDADIADAAVVDAAPVDAGPVDASSDAISPDMLMDAGPPDMPSETCGDGVVQGDEACDDGNLEPGDGCDAECQLEPACVAPCDDGDPLTVDDTCTPDGCQGRRPTPVLGEVELPDDLLAGRAVTDGALAFVALRGGGVQVLDIRTPAEPAPTGRWTEPGLACTDIAIGPGWIALACGAAGVIVLDAAPQPQVRARIDGPAGAVAVRGDWLYVAGGGELRAWDLSDPGTPVAGGTTETAAPVVRLAVDGAWLYCLYADGTIIVSSLEDPANPADKGRIDGPDNATDLVVRGGIAYCGYDGAGLRIVDIRDPENPRLLWEDGGSRTLGVALSADGRTLACIYGDGRYVTASLADRTRPVGLTESRGDAPATGVAVFDGGVAYCAYGGRINTVDVPPFVTDVSPRGAACPDATLSVWFNAPIDTESRGDFSVLRADEPVDGDIIIEGRQVRFEPAAPLVPGDYIFKIATRVVNVRGTRAAADVVVPFEVAEDCVQWRDWPRTLAVGARGRFSCDIGGLEGPARLRCGRTPDPFDTAGTVVDIAFEASPDGWTVEWTATGIEPPARLYCTPVIGAATGPTVPVDIVPVACDPAACDDGDACTADRCDPVAGCVSTPIEGCADAFDCTPEGAEVIDGMLVMPDWSNDFICATEWSNRWHQQPETNTCAALCATLDLPCIGARGGDFGSQRPWGPAVLGCDVEHGVVSDVNAQPDLVCLCDRGEPSEYVPDCRAAAQDAVMPEPQVCVEAAGGAVQNDALCLFESPQGTGTCDDICARAGTRCVSGQLSDFGFCGDGVGFPRPFACDAVPDGAAVCSCYRGQGEAMDALVCDAPLANCDGDDANGCEVDTQTDPAHCGGCDQPCDPGARCEAGMCLVEPPLPEGACMVAGPYEDPMAFGLPILNDYQAPGLMVPANPFVLDGVRFPNNFQLSNGACIPGLDSNAPGCGGANRYLVSFGGPNDIDPIAPVNRLGFRWGDQGSPTRFTVTFVDGTSVEHIIEGRQGFFGYCSPDLAIDRITMAGGDYGIDDLRCDRCQ